MSVSIAPGKTLCGLGISLLASWLVEEDLKLGRLVRLFKSYQTTATDFELPLGYSTRLAGSFLQKRELWLIFCARSICREKHGYTDPRRNRTTSVNG